MCFVVVLRPLLLTELSLKVADFIDAGRTRVLHPPLTKHKSLTVPDAPFRATVQGQDAMAGLSLREAAQQAGTSKSTILRAIQNGRLSAARTDDGGYSIDPAELFRVYPVKSSTDTPQQPAHRSVEQDAPTFVVAETPDAPELRIRNAALEAELSALKAILDAEKRRGEELREDRDRWHAQAERLALPAPAPASLPQRVWWPWRRAS